MKTADMLKLPRYVLFIERADATLEDGLGVYPEDALIFYSMENLFAHLNDPESYFNRSLWAGAPDDGEFVFRIADLTNVREVVNTWVVKND